MTEIFLFNLLPPLRSWPHDVSPTRNLVGYFKAGRNVGDIGFAAWIVDAGVETASGVPTGQGGPYSGTLIPLTPAAVWHAWHWAEIFFAAARAVSRSVAISTS